MDATPIFAFPFPEATDPPAGNVQIEEAVTKVEEALAEIEGLLLGAPAPGDLLVVNGTSDPVYKAVTGDIGFNSAGVTTIGAEKVLSTMVKNLAITAAKLAGEAVETAKLAGLSVTEAKLAALAVSAGKLAAECVETGKIKALAVTEAKIAAEAVSADKVIKSVREVLGLSSTGEARRGKSIIAGAEERNNAAFGTMPTPDQVEVVLPTDGLIFVSFRAVIKGTGSIAIFLGANQLKSAIVPEPTVIEKAFVGEGKNMGIETSGNGGFNTIGGGVAYLGDVATGQVLGAIDGGICPIFAAAGTYTVSIRLKGAAAITLSKRSLRVWTMGF